MKKIIAILMAAAVMLSLCSCKGNEEPETESTTLSGEAGEKYSEIQTKLVYSKTDSMNPFEAESTVNIRLMTLIYDGLFSLDASYTPKPAVAKSCAAGASVLNVTLDSSVKFSDGSAIEVSDVIYSFNLAKESPAYSARLANFESVTSSNKSTLIFSLAKPDVYAQNCLTFPIIKEQSDEEFPTGSGRYKVVNRNGVYVLEKNSYKKGFRPEITVIELLEIKSSDDMLSSLEIGNTCFSFDDLADGEYSRINASTVDVLMNNIVYLGINSNNEILSSPEFRAAVNACVAKNDIADSAFQGHAKAAASPFNPDWSVIAGKLTVAESDPAKAAELIAKSAVDLTGKTFTLLVNADNGFKKEAANLIAAQLLSAGIIVEVRALPYESYIEAVENEEFDFYIGEIRLTPDMNISALFSGGNCSYGVGGDADVQSILRYEQLLAGECEIMDFINTFNTEMPFIPLCYRSATVSYTNSLDYGNVPCCDSDVYSNIEKWKILSVKE